MSEICKKCGRDTILDYRYYKFRDRITNEKGELIKESEPYIVCENCYPRFWSCPKCGGEMESEDAGMVEIEMLFCKKCRPEFYFYIEIHIRRWYEWYQQYTRDTR